jgi:trk system potassium uptake protein TrkH
MMLGSIPFILYVQMLQGRFRPFLADEQVKAFAGFLAVAILAGWMMAHFSRTISASRACAAAFNVVSITTGTGYASTDYGLWGPHAVAFFFIIMFVGGCAGSTSCGIKIFRFQVLIEAVRQHVAQVMYPHGVFRARFNGKPIQDRVIASVMSFFFLFMTSFVVLAILLRLSGLDTVTALSGAGTALSNVGPGLGEIIGPSGNFQSLSDLQKWLLAAGMLLGRLELFTVLVLFLPRFWRS